MTEHICFDLPNGIRVIHQPLESGDIVHCGLIIEAGSRDELEEEHGLAHFIEHSLFKGTTKRKAFHVLSRLDAVGGELNAYTTKEDTTIYASFLSEYLERAIELLSDITFNSSFPEKELEKEKDIVVDEILSYMDSPSEQIFDNFEEQIFSGHKIGRNILGTEKSVEAFDREKILKFIKRNYSSNRIVFSSIGNISLSKLKNLCHKYLGEIKLPTESPERKSFKNYKPLKIEEIKDTFQSHCLLGNVAYSAKSRKRREMILLNNILGGPALNNRLNLSIREKHGYAYNVESNYTPYCDTGLFSVYFGTDPKYTDRCLKLVEKEFKKLQEKPLGTLQLHQAKTQLKGQIALSQENLSAVMITHGKSLLYFDKVDPLEYVYKKIDQLEAGKIQDVANEILDFNKMSQLLFVGKP